MLHVSVLSLSQVLPFDSRPNELFLYLLVQPISLDASLQSMDNLCYPPSQLAAASIHLARRSVGRNPWSPTLLHQTLYCEEEISPVAEALLSEQMLMSSELRAVRRKYGGSRWACNGCDMASL